MANRKGNDIFLGVVGVATLIVAIIGATFAWFSASVRGANNVNVSSATLELGFTDDTTNLTTLLIPTEEQYALYAATDPDWIAKNDVVIGKDEKGDDVTRKGAGLCKDDNGNVICGVYDFTVMNPNTTAMDITAEVISTVNTFAKGHMRFALYHLDVDGEEKTVGAQICPEGETTCTGMAFASPTEDGSEATVIVNAEGDPTSFADDDTNEGYDFNYHLIGSSTNISAANKDDFTKYTAITDDAGNSNIMNFRMVIYLVEANNDQTDVDSGKFLTAAIKINTLSGAGVTGVIAAAEYTAPVQGD